MSKIALIIKFTIVYKRNNETFPTVNNLVTSHRGIPVAHWFAIMRLVVGT
jgi:hypothetical protein